MKRVELAGAAGFWEALQRLPETNLYPQAASVVRFEGSCPYLFCLVREAHGHPVCEVCGAVRYANVYCGRCREVRELDVNPTVPVDKPTVPVDKQHEVQRLADQLRRLGLLRIVRAVEPAI